MIQLIPNRLYRVESRNCNPFYVVITAVYDNYCEVDYRYTMPTITVNGNFFSTTSTTLTINEYLWDIMPETFTLEDFPRRGLYDHKIIYQYSQI